MRTARTSLSPSTGWATNRRERQVRQQVLQADRISHRTRHPSRWPPNDARIALSSQTPRSGAAGIKEIRAWAAEQGYQISTRGRIPTEIEQAFQDAHCRPHATVAGGPSALGQAVVGMAISARLSTVGNK
nr:histone-like nucleoid-structuring protein Lsr2 [Rhodococcus wratislaviensis]